MDIDAMNSPQGLNDIQGTLWSCANIVCLSTSLLYFIALLISFKYQNDILLELLPTAIISLDLQ